MELPLHHPSNHPPTYPPRSTAYSPNGYAGYPPPRSLSDPQHSHHDDSMYNSSKPSEQTVADGPALRGRTPSPTPSELKELKSGAIDWKAMATWRFWIRREWLWYYVAVVIIVVLSALMTLYHKQIVDWLTPVTRWLHDLRFGWLVPIGVLFVISFPPLFGHEIVAVLCGLVWGLWIGFGIVAAGTFLGEVGNFYAFKYCLRSRGEKLERTNISYACLARVVRDGGFKIALIARLSAIPGHFTTAVFSACGMNIFVFCIAAILSMPKQFITVYLGVILEQSATGTEDKTSTIISRVVLAVTILITAIAMWYILHRMNKVKPEVIYAKRKARQAKLERELGLARSGGHRTDDISEVTLDTLDYAYPNHSESELPLTSRTADTDYYHNNLSDRQHSRYQYPAGQQLYAPVPKRAGQLSPTSVSRLESAGSPPVPSSSQPLQTSFDALHNPNNALSSSALSNPYEPSIRKLPSPTQRRGGGGQPLSPFDSFTGESPVPASLHNNNPYNSSNSLTNARSRSPSLTSPSPNLPHPNFSRPIQAPTPPSAQHSMEHLLASRRLAPSDNPFMTPDSHPSPFGQTYHLQEETSDTYRTALTGSPESLSDQRPHNRGPPLSGSTSVEWVPPSTTHHRQHTLPHSSLAGSPPPSYNSSLR